MLTTTQCCLRIVIGSFSQEQMGHSSMLSMPGILIKSLLHLVVKNGNYNKNRGPLGQDSCCPMHILGTGEGAGTRLYFWLLVLFCLNQNDFISANKGKLHLIVSADF